jgi:hypothetical protein
MDGRFGSPPAASSQMGWQSFDGDSETREPSSSRADPVSAPANLREALEEILSILKSGAPRI